MVKRYALLALFCACLINAFSYHDDSGALNGVFSVNANGKKVQFAMGNLQFQSATHTWHFAEHQWDMLGEQNEIYGSTYNGWISLLLSPLIGVNSKFPTGETRRTFGKP